MKNKFESYGAISAIYDSINSEIDYKRWADFVESCFEKHLPCRPELLLDLACGTGSMTLELAKRGYDMIGVDGSSDMLNIAYERKFDLNLPRDVLFLLQDMRSFELYGTVGATLCCLDSLNYLLDPKELSTVFSLVHNYSDPDALFIFDMNTPYKFEQIYSNNAYVLEDEKDGGAIYCGWQNFYDVQTKICDFYLSVFEENEDGSYVRSDEHQSERCYTEGEIRKALSGAGFELVGVYADYAFSAPTDTSERWYFVARAKK